MADNTVLPAGAGGDTIRDVEKGGSKTQVVLLDIGGLGVESLFTGAVTQSGTWNITDISGTISLPTGAATGAKQDTGNTSVASIDTKTPALGQALAAASVPVVLTAAQVTTLTPPAAITGYALEAGNLATLAGKDFATQTTLALVKAKTDNLDVALSTLTPLSTVAVTSADLTTIASAIKGEDAAATDADKGIPALAVRQDTLCTNTSNTGDYGWIKTDAAGRQWVTSDTNDSLVRDQNTVLLAILTELRVQNQVLQSGLNVRDDLDNLRQDPYFNASLLQ